MSGGERTGRDTARSAPRSGSGSQDRASAEAQPNGNSEDDPTASFTGKVVRFSLNEAPDEAWELIGQPYEAYAKVLRPWLYSEPDERGEQDAWCPLHEDPATSQPSASINLQEDVWYCHAGCGGGQVGELVWRMAGGEAVADPEPRELAKKRAAAPLPSEGSIHGWHDGLLSNRQRMDYLRDARGLTAETIRKYLIGWDRGEHRYVIPVYERGQLVNVRRYAPEPRRPGTPKYLGWRGHSARRLYPYDAFMDDPSEPVIICAGEWDVLRLRQDGFNAVTTTTGDDGIAGVVRGLMDLDGGDDQFTGRTIAIWTDADQAGESARRELVRLLDARADVYEVEPPDAAPPGWDVTDAWRMFGDTFSERVHEMLNTMERDGPDERQRKFMRTDLGNAERMVAQHGHNLHYCPPWKSWLVWDGTRWAPDQTLAVERRAKETVRSIYEEAANESDSDERDEIVKHAVRSESAAKIRNMIGLAESDRSIAIVPRRLDNAPWLLNVKNGTLDLRTGRLRDPRRDDLLTKLAPVTYDDDAPCPRWEGFLRRVLPDAEDRAFVQRAIGYSLTGSTEEQVLFILWGAGANGKSTFLETLRTVLGDYAHQAPGELLLSKSRGSGIPADVADLQGARFVSAVETDEGRKLAEALVKQLTGGDRVRARRLYSNYFEFEMEGKIWLATNSKPNIAGTNEAIWRRIRLIPFTEYIGKDERDPRLKQKLTLERRGILRWAVEGCKQWQDEGLAAPPNVQQATAEYRDEQDLLGDFIHEYCVVGEDQEVSTKALYRTYEHWCAENSLRPWSKNMLGRHLSDRGFERTKTVGGEPVRGYVGLGLKERGSKGGARVVMSSR